MDKIYWTHHLLSPLCPPLHLPIHHYHQHALFSSCEYLQHIRSAMLQSRTVHITFVSAQFPRPSSNMTWSTLASRSASVTSLGSRSAAEKWKFSRTVRVPITTSSCKRHEVCSKQNLNKDHHMNSAKIKKKCASVSLKHDDTCNEH